MEDFEVVFYRKLNGTVPMDEFLESLPPKLNAKVHRDLGALREEATIEVHGGGAVRASQQAGRRHCAVVLLLLLG